MVTSIALLREAPERLEQAVRAFEPRLKRVKIDLSRIDTLSGMLHFRIDGWLNLDPRPIEVLFDTVVQPENSEFVLKDQG